MAAKKSNLSAAQVYYYVSDMDKAVKFYTETLGLPLRVRFENHWAEVDAGPITIGLHPTEDGKKPKQGGGGTVSFQVSDFEKVVDELKKKGANVGKIHTPERGKFTMISDPDGNMLHMVEFNKKWAKENQY
jgi:predicted enzyme related to lactoylglutathione lyase